MTSTNSQYFPTGIIVREGLDTDYLVTNPRLIVTGSDISVSQSDYIIAIKQSSAINVFLPANAIGGTNIVIKDIAGNAAVHNLTVTTTDGSTIDGASSMVLNNNYASLSVTYVSGNGWAVL